MRSLFLLFALPLLASTAQAESNKSGTAATAPSHTRLTMQQHFEQANVTHDGHLTEEQAKAGYKTLARHFASVDQDKKGYITEDDIRAYYKMQRALHHQTTNSTHANTN